MTVSGLLGERFEVVVIGGGLAGLATAASLVSRGCSSVLVLESESNPGAHSSGKNAGLVRQAAEDPETTELCVRGAQLIREWGTGCTGLFQQTGSVILSDHDHVPASTWEQVEHRRLTEAEVRQYYPELRHWSGGDAWWTPADGTVNVPRLLGNLVARLVASGGKIALGTRAGKIAVADCGGFQIEVSQNQSTSSVCEGLVNCRQVVVANGAWAAEYSRLSQMPISLLVTNRGCLISDRGGFEDRMRPWIWSDSEGWYLRILNDGLLWSACEEEVSSAGNLALSTELEEYWRRKVQPSWGESATGLSCRSGWVGQRTFCPDRRFLLGSDSRCAGWHWAVGLGGHGVTSALAVGEEVAGSVLGESEPKGWAWSDERFACSSGSLS